MGFSSNEGVSEDEDRYREGCAIFIAHEAAKLVAAGDASPDEAIAIAAGYLRSSNKADADLSGVASTTVDNIKPSAQASPEIIASIQDDLMEAAREAASDF